MTPGIMKTEATSVRLRQPRRCGVFAETAEENVRSYLARRLGIAMLEHRLDVIVGLE